MRQHDIEKKYKVKYDLPVFYLTQLMAIAFGFPKEKMMFGKHIIPVDSALAHIGEVIEEPKKPVKGKKAVQAESEVE